MLLQHLHLKEKFIILSYAIHPGQFGLLTCEYMSLFPRPPQACLLEHASTLRSEPFSASATYGYGLDGGIGSSG